LQKRDEDDRYWAIRQAGLLTTIPVLLTVPPIAGFLAGRFLDGKLNTDPIFSVVLLIFGFIAGARQIARVVKLASRDVSKDGKKDHRSGA
jgi:F0F1-type ATP synthase assembly protein I